MFPVQTNRTCRAGLLSSFSGLDSRARFCRLMGALTAVWLGRTAGCNLSTARGAGQAPLAQSAERFHGKEKVNGSIPLGGSVDAGRASALLGGKTRVSRGGVAQLVRAHDS